MANILQRIIEDKRAEVEQRQSETSLDELKKQAEGLGRCRNFYKAATKTNKRGINVIAEIKKASPSAGVIRTDFEPVEIAKTYKNCGADAISVLTDEKYFQGRLEYVRQVKDAVDLPVLRKDFIIDPWQVYESKVAGADAILLIAEALKPAELMDLTILAAELTLTSLIEVHELDSLLAFRSLAGFPRGSYSLIGINNRDLTTMKVDINTCVRLAEFVENKAELVAESGIKTRADVERIMRADINTVLIGQTLCESENIDSKFAELFG